MAAHLTDPDVTRNGRGVGQGEAGALLTELLVLERVLLGHCGGPPNAPGLVLPPRLQHSAHVVIGVPVTPTKQNAIMATLSILCSNQSHTKHHLLPQYYSDLNNASTFSGIRYTIL